MPYLVIWEDRNGQCRLTLRGGNHETIFTTEGYTSKAGVENAARIVRSLNASTKVYDQTTVKRTLSYR